MNTEYTPINLINVINASPVVDSKISPYGLSIETGIPMLYVRDTIKKLFEELGLQFKEEFINDEAEDSTPTYKYTVTNFSEGSDAQYEVWLEAVNKDEPDCFDTIRYHQVWSNGDFTKKMDTLDDTTIHDDTFECSMYDFINDVCDGLPKPINASQAVVLTVHATCRLQLFITLMKENLKCLCVRDVQYQIMQLHDSRKSLFIPLDNDAAEEILNRSETEVMPQIEELVLALKKARVVDEEAADDSKNESEQA